MIILEQPIHVQEQHELKINKYVDILFEKHFP